WRRAPSPRLTAARPPTPAIHSRSVVLEPDSSSRVPPTHGAPPSSRFGPNALPILMTEHWSLLGARSLVYTEAMSRTSIFVASLAGSVVALALVSQATDFGDGFIAFALV